MHPDQSKKMIKMPIPERIRIAKEKTRRVVDHLHYLLELHENNAIVLYSPALSQQIPTSFAANAFKVFQDGMHQFEIVRLCALWDGLDLDKENVPTVIELIDHTDVIEDWRRKRSRNGATCPCTSSRPVTPSLTSSQRKHSNAAKSGSARSELGRRARA
jgi:hypothetical protein